MEGYQSQFDAEKGVVIVREKPRRCGAARLCALLGLLALCGAAAALLCVWASDRWRPETETEKEIQAEMLKSDATAKAMKQIASTKRAAIHLIGDKGVNEVQWLKEDDHSFFQGGLQLEENRVVIPRGGLYFVYTQASFKGKCQSTSHLSHNVILLPKAYGMEHSLLSAIRTVCRESVAPNADWYNALYQGAVFRLEAGDKLRTDTRSMKWLDESEGRTFFGVIEL